MTFTTSIARVKRLIADTDTSYFTDEQLRRFLSLAQQKFCRDSMHLLKVILIKAPPEWDYAYTYPFESQMGLDRRVFNFQRGSEYVATQPWELEEDYTGNVKGGWTLTSGYDMVFQNPQHEMPFIIPNDGYTMNMLAWDYNQVIERGFDRVWDEHQEDGWTKVGNVVDYFTMFPGYANRGFVTRGIPYDYQSTGDDLDSVVDEALTADTFTLVYVAVPEKATSNAAEFEVLSPYVKYVEHDAVARCFRSDSPLKDKAKAAHYQMRYQIGVELAKSVVFRQMENSLHIIGGENKRDRRGLGRPRLPDHYPNPWS